MKNIRKSRKKKKIFFSLRKQKIEKTYNSRNVCYNVIIDTNREIFV